MTQWTAAIRLAMYEHTSLYEAYTGSLIAAKGKTLNGIQSILAPAKFKHEDWARVRFGAGTPWRRCWFVINPPDEKELQKARKLM
jgi:CCR4-NOT transcriptional complex subunit CAF120